jgi:predicted DsbA family dithiol-disulfide isomerase
MAYEAGIFPSQAEAEAFAHSDELKSEVENGFLVARRKGISGVPNFEIEANDPTDSTKPPVMAEIPGAQEPETIAAFIGKIAQRVAPQSNA